MTNLEMQHTRCERCKHRQPKEFDPLKSPRGTTCTPEAQMELADRSEMHLLWRANYLVFGATSPS
jgi:hypothetical protein